jgi:succinoglycan biosynthesis protein ExoM
MTGSTAVCAGVCTIKRPQMLKKCLQSLAAQKMPAGTSLQIVVVDNDATPSSADLVKGVSATCPFPVHYFHEPRRGIPMARNRVLEEALNLGADWLAFMDDDETAHPDWIEKALFAARRDSADAISAAKIYLPPEPLPFWCSDRPGGSSPVLAPDRSDGPIESRRRKELPTNGVLLSARLFNASGMGLRFNEKLALGGLEDGDFFERARLQGAVLLRSCLPVVVEEGHASRYTYRRQVLRGLSLGGALVARYRLSNSSGRAALRYSMGSLARVLRGVAQLAISPIFIPFAMHRFKFTAIEGGRNLCVAAGMVGGLFSYQYEFYREIDGY